MLKMVLDFFVFPFTQQLKVIREQEKWFRDESIKAFNDGDIDRAMMLGQIRRAICP